MQNEQLREDSAIQSEVTRYLCAAAYLHPPFAKAVVRDILRFTHRAIAPSYGVDIEPVLKHSLNAQNRNENRNVWILFAWASVAAWCVLAGSNGLYPLIPFFVLTFIGTAWAILYRYERGERRLLIDGLTAGNFKPNEAPSAGNNFDQQRIKHLSKAQHGNITIYAGAAEERPFLGSGRRRLSWSFSTPLVRVDPKREAAPADDKSALTAADLYGRLRGDLLQLSKMAIPNTGYLSHLDIRDRIIMPGMLPRESQFVDGNGNVQQTLEGDELQDLRAGAPGRGRYYLEIQMASETGLVAANAFVHVGVVAEILSMEFIGAVMPSMDRFYEHIDSYPDRERTLITMLKTLWTAFTMIGAAPFALSKVMDESPVSHRVRLGDAIGRHRAFDYGATTSVRMMAASWSREPLIPAIQAEEFLSIVNSKIIQIVIATLEGAGYDVSDFKRHANVAIDNTMVTNINNITDSHLTNSPVGLGSSPSVSVSTIP